MTITTDRMAEEIKRRLDSDGWNFEMAGRVLARRRTAFRWKMAAGGFAAALAALAVALVMVLDRPGEAPKAEMYAFISEQVEGSYGEAFGKKGAGVTPPYVVPVALIYENTDSVIDGALAER